MSNNYIDLSYWQVGLAALLVIINGLISLLLRLKLEKKLIVSSIRMTVQLLLIGLVLHWVFALSHWYLVITLMFIMTLIAGITAADHTKYRYRGIWLTSIISIWSSSWFVTAIALFFIVQVKPWFTPQYAIPLLGMILGNTLNGISLSMDRFTSDLENQRGHVETLLALGATRWESARLLVQDAIRTGMIPMINLMMVTGIVSLPGMMTGQLLAGIEPISAVKYQIVIMFLIAAATALGVVCGVLLCFNRLFNAKHQFLFDELKLR